MPFKFSENETVDDITDVDENLRPFYSEGEDGKHTIREEFKATTASWDGMVTANTRIRKDNKSLQGSKVDLSPLSAYGATVTEIAEAFATEKQGLSDIIDKKKDAPNPEKIKKQMAESFAEKEKSYKAKNDALQSQLYATLITNEVQSAISAEKGDAELLLPFVTNQVKMVEVNGQQAARVLDSDGDSRYGATGSEMTVRELVSSMRKDKKFAKLFMADVKQGGGPPSNQLPTSGPRGKANLSPAEKIQAGMEKRRT